MSSSIEPVGYIILVHFDPPYKHAQHMYDWCRVIGDRIIEYKNSDDAPALVRAAVRAGSKITVVNHWDGTKTRMKKMRRSGNATRHCHKCRLRKELEWQDEHLEELLEESLKRAQELK